MPLFHRQSRAELRRMYLDAWRKLRSSQPLQPLEAQIGSVVAEHPEYHALLEAEEPALQAEFLPEGGAENPFLHMGLHLAVREQVATDRPPGITEVHSRLAQRLGSAHEAEHRMIEALAQALWEAQRTGKAPDESTYLENLKQM